MIIRPQNHSWEPKLCSLLLWLIILWILNTSRKSLPCKPWTRYVLGNEINARNGENCLGFLVRSSCPGEDVIVRKEMPWTESQMEKHVKSLPVRKLEQFACIKFRWAAANWRGIRTSQKKVTRTLCSIFFFCRWNTWRCYYLLCHVCLLIY